MKTVRMGRKDIDIEWTIVDRFVNWRDPVEGQKRLQARVTESLAVSGYKGASKDRRGMKDYGVKKGSADNVAEFERETLIDRSHQLIRNDPIANAAINTTTTSVVGQGLKVKPTVDAETLGISPEEARKLNKQLKRYFNIWAKNKDCDITRTQNFYAQQDLVYRSAASSGDHLVLFKSKAVKNFPFKTRLHHIEAARLSNPDRQSDTSSLIQGIGLDEDGAPKTYHITNYHPDNTGTTAQLEWIPVAAYGRRTGRRNVLHCFDRKRPDQHRGIPFLAPIIETLKLCSDLTDAELMKAVISGMFTVFLESQAARPFAPFMPNETGAESTDDDVKLGYGAVVQTSPGTQVKFADPKTPNTDFDPFMEALVKLIGSAIEVPFEILIKHFKASYSASKAALNEAWRFFKKRRKWLIDEFCQPCYEQVITELVVSRIIDAPGFLEDPFMREAYLSAEWHGDPQGQLNPKDESEARKMNEEMGWVTGEENTAELTGGDWETKHNQLVIEKNMRQKDGLQTDPNSANISNNIQQGPQQSKPQPPQQGNQNANT